MNEKLEIALDVSIHNGRTWLARITGTDEKFGLAREFVKITKDSRSRSGATGTVYYEISDGVYEGNEPRGGKRGRFFLIVEDSEVRDATRTEALNHLQTHVVQAVAA